MPKPSEMNNSEQPKKVRPEEALTEVFKSMFSTYMADLRSDVYSVNAQRLFNKEDAAMVAAYNPIPARDTLS